MIIMIIVTEMDTQDCNLILIIKQRRRGPRDCHAEAFYEVIGQDARHVVLVSHCRGQCQNIQSQQATGM